MQVRRTRATVDAGIGTNVSTAAWHRTATRVAAPYRGMCGNVITAADTTVNLTSDKQSILTFLARIPDACPSDRGIDLPVIASESSIGEHHVLLADQGEAQ